LTPPQEDRPERRPPPSGGPPGAELPHPPGGAPPPPDKRDLVGARPALQEVTALGAPFDQHFVRAPDQRDVLTPRDRAHRGDEALEPLARDVVGHRVLEPGRGGS